MRLSSIINLLSYFFYLFGCLDWKRPWLGQDPNFFRKSYPARALRALGLLLADRTPTGGRGEDFLNRQPDFFTETAVTPERKVEKWFPRWEINRHAEG